MGQIAPQKAKITKVPTLPILLLPGMDGTGDLLQQFVEDTPSTFAPRVVLLPSLASYDDILSTIDSQVPPDGRFAVLGHSFSGPLAVRLAARHAGRVAGIILCNTFIASPRTPLLRFLPWRILLSVSPPAVLVRALLIGSGGSNRLVKQVQSAAAKCGARILAARLTTVFALRIQSMPSDITCPVLVLRGTNDRLVPAKTLTSS